MTHQPSAAAASLAAPWSSLPSHSAASAEPLVVVAYDLRDSSQANASLAPPNIVELPPSARISHLQQAVFAANEGLLPPKYPYTLLDVYPPGSTDWTDRSAAADAEDDIARLLPGPDITDRHKRRFVVIARPLPSFGGARGSAVKLRSTSVPEHVRAVVGRVCAADERGVVADFVVSSIGTGVWFGKGGVVLTAYHVVEDLPDLSRIYFYLFNPGTGQWVRKLMEVAAYHDSWDIAVLQQVRSASRQRDGDSDYEPQVLDTLWAQPDADAWSIAFPQIIDTTLAPTARSSSTSVSASTSYASSSSSSSTLAPSAFAPSSSSVSVSLSLLSSSSSSASSTASSFSLTLSSPLLTSESSSTPASSSSSSSSSSSTSSFAFSSPTLSAPSTSTSVSSSVPASSAVDWQPQSPVITKGIISKIGFQHLIHVADYIAAPNSSGGAVVGQSEQGAWYLIGIHVGVVHHDIDRTQTVEEQVTQASGTSPFAEFIAIQSIQSWYEKALPPNCQVFNSSSNRKVERIVGEKRKRGSATGQSAAVVAPAAVDEGGEGGGEGDDELVYEVKEGWVGYYDRRLNPVPLPARPRAQSEPSPSHAAAVRAAGGGTTGSRGAQSL